MQKSRKYVQKYAKFVHVMLYSTIVEKGLEIH